MKMLGFTNQGADTVAFLSLEEMSEGNWKSIVDFQPLKDVNSLTTRTELSVQTSAEMSRKGVVRALVKVNIPYSGLYPADTATGASNLKFAPNRSNGSVSAHLVLTLPKECVQDIVQQKAGSTGRLCALAHIRAALAAMVHLNPITNGGCAVKRLSADGMLGSMVLPADPATGNPLVYLNDAGVLQGGSDSTDTGTSNLDTFVDRICRGYTPYAEQENIGVTETL